MCSWKDVGARRRRAPTMPKPSRGRAKFTSAIYAAALHNAAMTMGYLWEGRPLPGPPPLGEGTGRLPAGRGLGKPGCPIPQPLVGAAGAPPGRGMGKPGFPVCSPQILGYVRIVLNP